MSITADAIHDKMSAIMDNLKTDRLEWVEWMRDQREERKWTQQYVAEQVGTTRQTINDYEKYRRVKNPDAEILAKISALYGEDETYLPNLAGKWVPASKDTHDPWVNRMIAKIMRVPFENQAAVEKMIESLAEKEIEPRQKKSKTNSATR